MGESIEELIGQRGTIVGDHPWAGHHGTIVRGELTIVGYGVVVKLDDSHDSPHGEECFVFHGKLWRPDRPVFRDFALTEEQKAAGWRNLPPFVLSPARRRQRRPRG